jgi:hypothetical protein
MKRGLPVLLILASLWNLADLTVNVRRIYVPQIVTPAWTPEWDRETPSPIQGGEISPDNYDRENGYHASDGESDEIDWDNPFPWDSPDHTS